TASSEIFLLESQILDRGPRDLLDASRRQPHRIIARDVRFMDRVDLSQQYMVVDFLLDLQFSTIKNRADFLAFYPGQRSCLLLLPAQGLLSFNPATRSENVVIVEEKLVHLAAVPIRAIATEPRDNIEVTVQLDIQSCEIGRGLIMLPQQDMLVQIADKKTVVTHRRVRISL